MQYRSIMQFMGILQMNPMDMSTTGAGPGQATQATVGEDRARVLEAMVAVLALLLALIILLLIVVLVLWHKERISYKHLRKSGNV